MIIILALYIISAKLLTPTNKSIIINAHKKTLKAKSDFIKTKQEIKDEEYNYKQSQRRLK